MGNSGSAPPPPPTIITVAAPAPIQPYITPILQAAPTPPPAPPPVIIQPPSVNTTNNNTLLYSPSNVFNPQTYDEEFSQDSKKLLKIIVSSFATGGVAYMLNEDPYFYLFAGGLLNMLQQGEKISDMYIAGGGTILAKILSGSDIVKTGFIISVGTYLPDIFSESVFNGRALRTA